MTKLAIKKETLTSFGGIYHIMDEFSRLGLAWDICDDQYFSNHAISKEIFNDYPQLGVYL